VHNLYHIDNQLSWSGTFTEYLSISVATHGNLSAQNPCMPSVLINNCMCIFVSPIDVVVRLRHARGIIDVTTCIHEMLSYGMAYSLVHVYMASSR
jgi:hypothetical protein